MIVSLLLYFPLLLVAQQAKSSCLNSSFCSNCDSNGNCTTCPTTRQLITHQSQQICGCSQGYGESNQQQCQVCTNLYCYNCQSVQTSLCISCGNQSVTHRQLNNSDCVCIQGYINVPWSFNCQTTQFDKRMLRFKNNMGQQAKIQALKTYVINSQDEGTLVKELQINTVVTTNGNSSCSLPGTMDEAAQLICPQGQLYQKIDQNMYGLAYLNSNQNPSTNWQVNFYLYGLSVSQRFIYQRNLTLVYNIIGFQLQNSSGDNPLVLELVIVEVLKVSFQNTNRRMLQDGSNQSKQSNSSQPYMQYHFFIGYSRATLLNETELEDAIDRLMSLINGCMDFCAQCSIFRNSIQCTQCYGTRQFVNGSCQCNQTAALATQCQNSCKVGCQKCIQDCYNCQDITKQDYSDCPIPASSPYNSSTNNSSPNNSSPNNSSTNNSSPNNSSTNNSSPNNSSPNNSSPNNSSTNNSSPNVTSQPSTTNQSAQNISKYSNSSHTSSSSNGSSQSNTPIQNQSSTPNNNSLINSSNQSSATLPKQKPLQNNTPSTDTSTIQIPKTFNTTSTPNATSSMINLTDDSKIIHPASTAIINSTIIPKSLAESDSSLSQNPPTSPNLSLNENTTQNPNVSNSSDISLEQINKSTINSNQNLSVLNQIIPDFLPQNNNSTNQTNSSQSDQKPLYGALGAVGAAVLVAAPLAYLYFAQRQASRFLPNQGIDNEGIVWPHKKFSLPSGREISDWERPLQNDTIERFLNQNQNYQQMQSQLHQQQTNSSINF